MIGTILCILLTASSLATITSATSKPSDTAKEQQPIELTIDTPAFHFTSITTEQGSFATIDISDEGSTTTIGEAKLPLIHKMIEIPFGANPTVLIEKISWKSTSLQELGLPARIVPVQASVQKIPDAPQQFVLNDNAYTVHAFVPTDVVRIVSVGEMRGRRVALVEISPVQYNPSSGELKLLTSCKLQINLAGSNMKQTTEKRERYTSPSFESLFQSAVVNYNQYNAINQNTRNQGGYLIIVYDSFYTQIQPFKTWKQTEGYTVTVTNTSQIPGGITTQNIKNYITNAYNTWSPPPSFVLLVGDTGQIPTWTGSATGTCTDLYYVTITAGDYFPDIFIGRFPAATAAQVTVMVDKTLWYEQGNYPSAALKKAVFMASDDNYQVSEGTHNYVINTYLAPNLYSCDTLYYHEGATTQQVKDAINNGRLLAVYSGHGSETSWADGPPFSQSDINSLANNGLYPFVCSHACLTNQFTVGECFGETWLRAPNKGAMVYWGSSDYTYWDEDDILERGMFSSWWDEGLELVGQMTDRALYHVYQYYGGGGNSQYYFEAYNVLGDPSVHIPAMHFIPVNDVGVTEITSPALTTHAGTQSVIATVRNYGNNSQTAAPVTCQIYGYTYLKDFEANNGGYTAGGTPSTLWQWGVPTSGPGGAHSGTKLWATNLAGAYPDSANAYLTTGLIQLPSRPPITLSFWQWYDMESYYDGGNVKISTNNGSTWALLGSYGNPYNEDAASSSNAGIPGQACFSGSQQSWQQVTFDLGSYAGQWIQLRWHFGSDTTLTYNGWYIDDVVIDTGAPPVYTATATASVDAFSNTSVTFTPPWSATTGTYKVVVSTALPGDQRPSNDQQTKVVSVLPNDPPVIPAQPVGPIEGIKGNTYTYTTQTTDPNGDQLYYMWDWGDGNTSGWLGPYPSGQIASAAYAWSLCGTCQVKVKAKDIYGAESNWSTPLPVNMYKLGDVNNDGFVSWRDIDPFVAAMNINETVFETQHPEWEWLAADCNQDGYVTWRDIDPFVALMNT